MPLARQHDSVLLIVDLQPSFLKAIPRAGQVLRRSEFMLRMATLLEVPVLATEQYPVRMGGTAPQLLEGLASPPIGKMTFSCHGCKDFDDALPRLGRKQVVICGIETHICVNQTTHHLLEQGYEVLIAEDAVGGRGEDAHRLALERMRQSGAVIAHTESIAYEWMVSAEHPKFKEALGIVKQYADA